MANQKEINSLRKQIKQYEAMEEDGTLLSEGALARLDTLRQSLRTFEVENDKELNFRSRPVGETNDYGVISVCPVCSENAAMKFSPSLRATMFVHSLVKKPGLPNLRRLGNRYTDAGADGPWGIGDFHMASASGQPVMPAPKSSSNTDIDRGWKDFYNRYVDTKKVRQIIDVDLEPTKQTRKAKVTAPAKPAVKVVPEWRRLAAQKAWEKIRANRAAKLQAAA